MTEILSLAAELRTDVGTGAAKALRRRGMVPATIYGAGREPMSIAVPENELTKYYRKPQFISRLIELEIDKKKYKVLPKAVDLHPITDIVHHADFVFLEDKIQKMQVPIVYQNRESCLGIKRGGYFNIQRRSATISCPVDKLPRSLVIDTKNMPIGTSIKAKNIELPEGAKLVGDPNFVVASIIGKRGKTTAEDSAEQAAEGVEDK